MKKIAVGISGGVDSSVAALILKKAGFDVIGVFMKNWDSYMNNDFLGNKQQTVDGCNTNEDFSYAQSVCKKIGIPLYKVEFIKEYWDNVFLPFIDAYKKGLTPNPDVLCNQHIKFGYFLDYCINNLNCDYVATGHYAGTKANEDGSHSLIEAKDSWKDQTYFLCNLNQKQLSKALFPLQALTKEEVRIIAKEYGLDTWDKKDSTGICFIGERNFKSFLSNYINNNQGDIVDVISNEVIGKHNGVHLYTIGQRKGLNLGGHSNRHFVCGKDVEKNILYVTDIENEKDYLLSKKCVVKDFNWTNKIPNNNQVEMRFRHTQKKINGWFNIIENNKVELIYPQASKSVTEGQYAVLYQDGICLGGGEITYVLHGID